MKISIDYDLNQIYIPSNTNLGEIVNELKKIFPNGEWKKYNLTPEPQYIYSSYSTTVPNTYYTVPYTNNPTIGTVPLTNGQTSYGYTTNQSNLNKFRITSDSDEMLKVKDFNK